MEVLGLDVVEHLVEEFPGLPSGHGQVVEQPVAAVLWRGTGNLAFIVGNEAERAPHQAPNR